MFQFKSFTGCLIVVLILLLDLNVNACMSCTESYVHLFFPFMVPVIFVLGIWRLGYALIQFKSDGYDAESFRIAVFKRLFLLVIGFVIIIR